MIKSMTGFGKSTLQLATKKINIEIKSLNSKGMDINMRIPQSYRPKELELRKFISEQLIRGKTDVSIYIEENQEQGTTKVNIPIVQNYIKQLQNISEGSTTELLKMAIRMPDALTSTVEEPNVEEYQILEKCLKSALDELQQFRTQEGKVLKQDFINRIETIKKLLIQVESIDPERSERVREKLQKAISDIENVDANRFEQELIYYLEKYDITEEKIRLKNHLEYFLKSLHSEDSNGRKLGFICQEIGREINTIGSKANYAPMQQIVVEMKDELEKIKEQVLNVL